MENFIEVFVYLGYLKIEIFALEEQVKEMMVIIV